MRYAFIHAQRQQHGVGILCKVMEVARSGYYAWCKRPVSRRAEANATVLADIQGIHRESRGTYERTPAKWFFRILRMLLANS